MIPVIDRRVVDHIAIKRKAHGFRRISQPDWNGEDQVDPQVLKDISVLDEQLLQLLRRTPGLFHVFYYENPFLPGLIPQGLAARVNQPVTELNQVRQSLKTIL